MFYSCIVNFLKRKPLNIGLKTVMKTPLNAVWIP